MTTISISFPHFLFLISHFLVPSFIRTRANRAAQSHRVWVLIKGGTGNEEIKKWKGNGRQLFLPISWEQGMCKLMCDFEISLKLTLHF